MRKVNSLYLCAMFSVCLKAQLPVPLGSAANFGVLASSTVTNTGATLVTGSLGISPGTSLSGFPPGTVDGVIHLADGTAATAQNDLTIAYNNAQGRPAGTTVATIGAGGTLTPGVYTATSTLGISGTLTLNGAGVYIFQIGSGLNVASGSQVILAGGATADNVFWQVGSSAILGSGSIFYGDILAQASITENTGAVLNGRALARTGAVTLQGNTDTNPDGPGPGAPNPTPAPASLSLVGTGLACTALYQWRKRLLRA